MIIQKTSNSRIGEFDPENIGFGTAFIDHMIVCEYENGKWGEVRLMPYGPLPFTPAMMGVNYGQACFEGMKEKYIFSVLRKISKELISQQSVLQCRKSLKKCLSVGLKH